ncbi:sialate O-acetylesterase [Desertivirga xinjiangensis]|uniref:sialate O-acetylesterase n=1 Tax=Desertivirga xinjiangensis TaxID=539206 RepID=UPI00210BB2F6|nr:sialate O-acetylesterase [Pedobacter xinjiangensis]
MRPFFLIISFFLFAFNSLLAEVRLPRLISNNMILQRDQIINIWGWAKTGEKVTVRFNNKSLSAKAGSNGKWQIAFPAMKAGGPYIMQIDADNHITLSNILLGDVWVCSGQSNMELPMSRVKPKFGQVVSASANPNIRQFDVAMRYSFRAPKEDFDSGSWVEANPESVLNFTAVGYFFAKELYEKYKVPIGLIKSAVGGSPAEAWLSEKALLRYPHFLELTRRYKDSTLVDSIKKADAQIVNSWNARLDKEDKGLRESPVWYSLDYKANDWELTQIPGYKNTNGVVWFRKEIDVPVSMTGKPALLILGAIVDRDVVYVNGKFAGSTGYQYPPRRYKLPAGLLKPGKNEIVIRVISYSGRGGFVKDKEYALQAEGQSINLQGDWQYKLGYASEPMPGGGTTFQYQPGGLFNGMIAPLLKYSIKGVIWYQGESNTGREKEYQQLFPDVIRNWRSSWKQGEFPFLFVQLANFMEVKAQPSESEWAELREAQSMALSLPNTAMAVTIDVGEWNDIHPLDKQTVGRRLSLAAQKIAYGDNGVVYSGPTYQSDTLEGNKVVIIFDNIGSGLVAKNGGLKGFAIAGADKRFVWAQARIEGNRVIVWNDEIRHPVAVRYAWADNPEGANLYNKEGLPASPFRTDAYSFNTHTLR